MNGSDEKGSKEHATQTKWLLSGLQRTEMWPMVKLRLDLENTVLSGINRAQNNKPQLCMVAHTYSPKSWKDGAGELHQVQGQSELHRDSRAAWAAE